MKLVIAGEKQYSFEEFLAIFKQTESVKEWGTFRDFEEAFKSFDREGQGFISAAECRHLLTAMGQICLFVCLFVCFWGKAWILFMRILYCHN